VRCNSPLNLLSFDMQGKTTLLWTSLALCVFVAGCTNLSSVSSKVEDFSQITDNVYRLRQVYPWVDRYSKFRDLQIEKARDYCERQGKGMMPIDAISDKHEKGGYAGEIIFRCVKELPNPNKGLFG